VSAREGSSARCRFRSCGLAIYDPSLRDETVREFWGDIRVTGTVTVSLLVVTFELALQEAV
jgi:hypothetical protein